MYLLRLYLVTMETFVVQRRAEVCSQVWCTLHLTTHLQENRSQVHDVHLLVQWFQDSNERTEKHSPVDPCLG